MITLKKGHGIHNFVFNRVIMQFKKALTTLKKITTTQSMGIILVESYYWSVETCSQKKCQHIMKKNNN